MQTKPFSSTTGNALIPKPRICMYVLKGLPLGCHPGWEARSPKPNVRGTSLGKAPRGTVSEAGKPRRHGWNKTGRGIKGLESHHPGGCGWRQSDVMGNTRLLSSHLLGRPSGLCTQVKKDARCLKSQEGCPAASLRVHQPCPLCITGKGWRGD